MTTEKLEQLLKDLDVVYKTKTDDMYKILSNLYSNIKEISSFTEKTEFNLILDNYLEGIAFLPEDDEIYRRYSDSKTQNKLKNTKEFIQNLETIKNLTKDKPVLENIDDYISFYKTTKIFLSKIESHISNKNYSKDEKPVFLKDVIRNSIQNYESIIGNDPKEQNILNLISYNYSLVLGKELLENDDSKLNNILNKLKKVRDDMRNQLSESKKISDEIGFEYNTVLPVFLEEEKNLIKESKNNLLDFVKEKRIIPHVVFEKDNSSRLLNHSLELFLQDSCWDYEKSLQLKRQKIDLLDQNTIQENKTLNNLDEILENFSKVSLSYFAQEIENFPDEVRKKELFKTRLIRYLNLFFDSFTQKKGNRIYGSKNNEKRIEIYDSTFNNIFDEFQNINHLLEKTKDYFQKRKKKEITKLSFDELYEVNIQKEKNSNNLLRYYFLADNVSNNVKIMISSKILDENLKKLVTQSEKLEDYMLNTSYDKYKPSREIRDFFISKYNMRPSTLETIKNFYNDYLILKENFLDKKEE